MLLKKKIFEDLCSVAIPVA